MWEFLTARHFYSVFNFYLDYYGINHVEGTPGNDALEGTDSADSIHAHAGDDRVSAGGGNDIVYGDDGNDFLYGGAGNDTLYGGPGNDTLLGDSGNDYLDGGPGTDLYWGSAGADTYVAGSYDFDVIRLHLGDSPAVTGRADTLVCNPAWILDVVTIDVPADTDRLIDRYYSSATSIEEAAAEAQSIAAQAVYPPDAIGLMNKDLGRAYLMLDLDQNGDFETGLNVKGSGMPPIRVV